MNIIELPWNAMKNKCRQRRCTIEQIMNIKETPLHLKGNKPLNQPCSSLETTEHQLKNKAV